MYKLMELQKGHGLLRPGQRVVDLGCWPGGWLQFASEIAGPRGRVVGVDLVLPDPPLGKENTIALLGDIREAAVSTRIRDALGGMADVLLCDAAPKLSGVRASDRATEENLLLAVEARLFELLRPGGSLLMKLLEGPEAQAVAARIRQCFDRSRIVRPRATRAGSSEAYLAGRGFRPERRP